MAKKPRPELLEIARRVLEFRVAVGFPDEHGGQAAFCEAVGLKRNRYNQWEKGHIRPPEKGLKLVRKKFPGLTYEWIWDGDPRGLSLDLALRLGVVKLA